LSNFFIWRVSQSILVGHEVSEYVISGRIDLAHSRAQRRPVLLLDHIGAACILGFGLSDCNVWTPAAQREPK